MNDAHTFLENIRGDAKQGYITISTKRPGVDGMKSYWFALSDDITKVINCARENDSRGLDVYVSSCISNSANDSAHRQSSDDVSTITAYYGDFDTLLDPEKVKKNASLPADPVTLNGMLSVCAVPPSVCVCSGHGVHAWWIFDTPVQLHDKSQRTEAGERLRAFIEAVNNSLGGYDFDTQASELARVLRIPGTHNHKNGGCLPVEIMPGATWRRYSMAELDSFTAQYAPVAKEEAPAAIRSNTAGLTSDMIEIIEKIRQSKNGELFSVLFDRGDISRYKDDDSKADLALCGMFAFWFNKDARKMDEAFRASALYRDDKWDKMHSPTQTYGEMTIEKAITSLKGPGYQPKQEKRATVARPFITIEDLEAEVTARGYFLRLNDITREMDVFSNDGDFLTYKNLLTRMHSALQSYYKGCGLDALNAYLEDIAERHSYNPVLEYIDSLGWDGKDHIAELYDLMGISNDPLSCVLVRKWLLQGYALLHNERRAPFGAEGVLTLQGSQGCGKTSLFRHLALRKEWFLEGASIDNKDKDTLRRACTRWIVELGEVESTMKSDVERLKAFVTSAEDVYRVPYGRADEKHPRRTSLCATCNSDRYLIDTTGNRRWFTVVVDKTMAYEDIIQLNAEQIWAQIAHSAFKNGLDDRLWRLTPDERSALDERNGDKSKYIKGEAEVIDILAEAKENPAYVWELLTVSAWKEHFPVLKSYSGDQISKALSQQGYKTTKRRVNGVQARFCELPIPRSIYGSRLKFNK